MSLSNPPAVVESSPMAALDSAVIRLRIGDAVYGIPLADIAAQLDTHMPAFVTGKGELGAREQAVRSGIKALLPMGLRLLASDVETFSRGLQAQGAAPLPLPDLKARHADLLDYSVRYLAALILSVLSSQTWEASIGERVEGAGGYVRLSGLSGSPATTPTPGGDGPDAA